LDSQKYKRKISESVYKFYKTQISGAESLEFVYEKNCIGSVYISDYSILISKPLRSYMRD